MFNNNMQSSNPVLANDDAFNQYYSGTAEAQADVTTLQGVVNKTAILVGIAIVTGAGGYALAGMISMPVLMVSWIITLLVTLGLYYKIYGNPAHAVFLAPIYAALQGVFLGALTGLLEGSLASMGIEAAGGLALQAFIITISIMLAMLGLYYARILQPTKTFQAVVMTLTAGIMITYLISMGAYFLFGAGLPFLRIGSAVEGGYAPMIGLGLNVLILGIAAMWLIMDFGLVEEKVKSGAPKHMEWFCGFALIVSLAWIYWEAVKLAFRLAILFANRD